MPSLDIPADFVKHMRRQMKIIRRLHAGKKLKYTIAGGVITHIDDLAKPMWAMSRLYLQHISDLHLRIAFHGDLLTINRAANAAGQNIMEVLDNLAGAADAVDPVVRRMLSVEAHHFIPATSFQRFPFMGMVFPDTSTMPAVTLLRLEHQGPKHLIEQMANQVGVLGSGRKGVLTASMTTQLNGKADLVSALSSLNEKEKALRYLDEIVGLYDSEYADVGNGVKLLDRATDMTGQMAGWTARDWIVETRRTLASTPLIP